MYAVNVSCIWDANKNSCLEKGQKSIRYNYIRRGCHYMKQPDVSDIESKNVMS